MNRIRTTWTNEQIENYYLGIKYSDYPNIFWDRIKNQIVDCKTLIDIGCGPGAFAIKAAEFDLDVQAVDVNVKHIQVLKHFIERFNLRNIELITGQWPEVNIKKSDVSICGYSLGGEIGTMSGIEKVLNYTDKKAFFIVPYSKIQTDFSSVELYESFGIEPPMFNGSYIDTLEIFEELGQEVTFEIIENDFGMPMNKNYEISYYADYLSKKLGIPEIDAIKNHLMKIATLKNGQLWIPNIRKSVMITWKKI